MQAELCLSVELFLLSFFFSPEKELTADIVDVVVVVVAAAIVNLRRWVSRRANVGMDKKITVCKVKH